VPVRVPDADSGHLSRSPTCHWAGTARHLTGAVCPAAFEVSPCARVLTRTVLARRRAVSQCAIGQGLRQTRHSVSVSLAVSGGSACAGRSQIRTVSSLEFANAPPGSTARQTTVDRVPCSVFEVTLCWDPRGGYMSRSPTRHSRTARHDTSLVCPENLLKATLSWGPSYDCVVG
jgi:hypothetical protein